MYDYSSEVFHVGHLVPDIQVAMDELGSSLGLEWTEVVHRDGVPVGYVRAASYGHTLGGAMGFGYVDHPDGVTAELVDSGDFEIVVAGERVPARASLRSMYDPGNERVRM